MKFLVLGQFTDLQTGVYIVLSAEQLGHEVKFIDTRKIFNDEGAINSQTTILKKIVELDFKPDIIIVLKGLEMSPNTYKRIKNYLPEAKLVNWFFDVYMEEFKIWDNKNYADTLRLFDYYFCSLKGVADKLREKGFNNAYFLPEACFPESNGEQYINWFQTQKYGSDIAFAGSIGYSLQHKDRIKYISLIAREGFDLQIWGEMINNKNIPLEIRQCHTGVPVINETHSLVAQASLVNLGIDQDPKIDMGFSARVYRVLACGGLFYCTATKGLENFFKINKQGEKLTEDLDLVVFYDEDDLVEQLDYLLEHDELRKKIAENGKKKVLENHTFKHRINEMIEIIKGETNAK